MTTFYQFAVRKAREYINTHPFHKEGNIDVFTFSSVLAVVFDKNKEDVINDIVFGL